MNWIEKEWQAFSADVVAEDAEGQLREALRVAFYAGATAMLGGSMHMLYEHSADETTAFFDDAEKELAAFAKEVGDSVIGPGGALNVAHDDVTH